MVPVFTNGGEKYPFMFSLSWTTTQTTTHAFPWQLLFSWSISQHTQKHWHYCGLFQHLHGSDFKFWGVTRDLNLGCLTVPRYLI